MTESVFNAYSRYYDLLYKDKEYSKEVDYIDNLLKRNNLKGTELLEFGSGTGKHGHLLTQIGYQVTGIERSESMVAQAEQGEGFTCQVGDIACIQLGRTFDAVISLFHVISYLNTNEALIDVFKRASEHLLSGGLFIFDAWYTPAVYMQQPSTRIKRLEGDGLRVTRIAEPEVDSNENRVDVNYQIIVEDLAQGNVESFSERHAMRHFSLPEVSLLAQINGFELVDAEEFLSGKIPSENTWGVCFILRKK